MSCSDFKKLIQKYEGEIVIKLKMFSLCVSKYVSTKEVKCGSSGLLEISVELIMRHSDSECTEISPLPHAAAAVPQNVHSTPYCEPCAYEMQLPTSFVSRCRSSRLVSTCRCMLMAARASLARRIQRDVGVEIYRVAQKKVSC